MNEKIRLNLEALAVESFATASDAGPTGRGTVDALSETETRLARTECRACPTDQETCLATCDGDTCQLTCAPSCGYCTDYVPSCAICW